MIRTFLSASAVVAVACGALPAAAQSFEWTSGAAGKDLYNAVAAMPNGDLVVAGELASGAEYDSLGWVRRLDPAGDLVWEQSFDFGGWDRLKAVAVLPDGSLIAAGVAEAEDRSSVGWVIRLAADGTPVWNRTYAASAGGNSGFAAVDVAPDGTLLLAGFGGVDAGGQPDIWLVRLDDTGAVQWERSLDNSGWDEAMAVLATADGGMVVAGSTAILDPEKAGLVLMLDAAGEVAWTKPVGKGRNVSFWDLVALPDGTLAVAGAGNDDDGNRAGLVVGISAAGEPLWYNFLHGSGRSAFLSLAMNPTGDLVAAGWTTTDTDDLDGWAVALDSEGGDLDQWQFGGPDDDRMNGLAYSPQNGWVGVGQLAAPDPTAQDGWVISLEAPRARWLLPRQSD